MAVVGELCGHSLDRGSTTPLWSQLFEALRQEILRGRWAEGERIPSFKEILGKTGVSRNSLLRALDQLEAGGYIDRVRHKGVFVKTTATHGNRSLGTVAILVPSEAPIEPRRGQPSVATQAFGQVSVGHVMEEAGKLGLKTRVVPIPASAGAPAEDTTGEEVFGVISLLSRRQTAAFLGGAAERRVVYLGTDDPLACPCLAGEPFLAAYRVIAELAKRGHRRIGLLRSPALSAGTEERVRNGVAAALRDAGIAPGAESLADFADPGEPIPADITAVFGFDIDCARICLRNAVAQGRRVPEDLCVASLQTGRQHGHGGRAICGAAYEWREILATCFERLLAPNGSKQRPVVKLIFEPTVHRGDTLERVEEDAP